LYHHKSRAKNKAFAASGGGAGGARGDAGHPFLAKQQQQQQKNRPDSSWTLPKILIALPRNVFNNIHFPEREIIFQGQFIFWLPVAA
jgi:hypothetical protein